MKQSIGTLLCSILTIATHAATTYTETVDGITWTYTVSSSGYASIGSGDSTGAGAVSSASGELVIPDTLGGYPVTGIGSYALRYLSSVTNFVIPATVRTIGKQAFCGSKGFSTIALPNNLYSIGDAAFYYCYGLKEITIPSSVNSIQSDAFRACTGLRSVTIEEGVKWINSGAFYDCRALESITIPYGAAFLEGVNWGNEFTGCSKLKTAYVPRGFRYSTENPKSFPNTCSIIEYDKNPTLTIFPSQGCPVPDAGVHQCSTLATVNASVQDVETNNTRYICTGWTGTGSVPQTGTDRFLSFVLTEDSSIQWNWRTDYRIAVSAAGSGSCSFGTQWIEAGKTVIAELVPATHLYMISISGDTNDVTLSGTTLTIPSNQPRNIAVTVKEVKLSLDIESAHGTATPNAHSEWSWNDRLSASVREPEPTDGVRYVCTGWTGTGSVPTTGTATNVTFTILEDSSVTWNWRTDNQIAVSVAGDGSCTFGTQWVADGTTATAEIVPATHLYTISLTGDTNGVTLAGTTLSIPSDGPRNIEVTVEEIPLSLDVSTIHGTATPSGSTTWSWGDTVAAGVQAPTPSNGVRHVCTGWTGTGSAPATGTGMNVEFTIEEDSTLVWNWRKENQLAVSVAGDGTSTYGTQWVEDGTTATVEIVPATHLYTIALAGDTNGVTLAGTTLSIPSDGPRNIAVMVMETKLALDVASTHGTPTPTPGRTQWSWDDLVEAMVVEPEIENGWDFRCTGWTGTGSVPSSGTGTNVAFTIEEDSSIVWNWATNVWLDCSATGFASIAFEPCWTNFGETVVIPFEPKDIGFSWTATGNTKGVVVDETARTISVPADQPRTIRFDFSGTTRADAASGGGKPVEWTHGGDAEWFVDFADENDESGFLRSGEIGTSSNSWTEIAVRGPGRLDFDWRVSCNNRGHYAQVLVDDTQWKRIAGTTDWTEETIEIGEGEHRIRWNYVKGTTSASGEDRACLDNVVWRPYVNLYVSSQGETNGVPYGSSTHLWGDRIEAQAGPPATYENERYVCSGWECRSIKPGFGSETNVSFNIIENSSLTWKWRREIWLEVKTRGPIEVPFESGWAAQHTNGTWSVRKVRDLETDIITYYSMSATNALHVEVLVPYTSFLLVCDDLPTTTNHFPMVASCLSTWNIFLSPPEPGSESPSPVDSKDQLVDETSSHRVVFDKDSGILSFDCTHACRIVLIATEMTLATALDTHGLDWTTSGADVWIPQDAESSDGEDSAKSGTIRGDDASVLRTTLTGPGTLSWKWRLDLAGIAGVDVFLDNAPIDGLYEATDWAERSLQIAGDGEHEIRFEFWNAGDETTLSDCAYLDQVKWSGKLFGGGTETTPVSVPYEWLNRYPDLLEANGGDYEATAWSTAENGANKVWECYVAGLDPTNQASAFLANIEMKDDEPFISWTPDLGSERVYTVEGKEALDDSEWAIPTNELSRFFRVRVSLDGTPAEPREIFVRFHPNGGTVSPAFGFYESDAADCVFPVPTRVGYEFVGWFTDPEGGDRIVSVADAQSSSLSLFAHWSPIHYTIVFDANGGTGEMESIEASYGVATTLPPNSFKGPEGGRFQGWSRTADGTADIPDAGTVSNLTATAGETVILFAVWTSPLYCVIDLSEGSSATEYPVSYLANVPEGGWTDEYKTTKLVLRLVEAGSFIMGSNQNNESHRVELTKPFYIGVFEVTQKQYKLVSGSNPSRFSGDTLPVDHVSYIMLRGASSGAGWPASASVDADSFFGKLRSRTGIDFDLPTDAQWEYACRAGTTTTYYWGDSMDGDYAWYSENAGSTSHQVGTTKPNAWGLYDMAGNAWEWCLDWYSYSISSYGIDPKGPASGSVRLTRSGNWWDNASHCPSAFRSSASTSCANDSGGFRIVGPLEEQ